MKSYFLYILTGIVTFGIVMFFYGVSAGFANYTPIMAIISSALLFTVAAPALIAQKRLGLIIGIIGELLILPFAVGLTVGIFEDGGVNWGIILAFLPIVLILLSLLFTVKDFKTGEIILSRTVKIMLIGAPILLFLLYIGLYGKYWNWQIFKL